LSHELQYILFPLVHPIPLPLLLISASSLYISLHYITVYYNILYIVLY